MKYKIKMDRRVRSYVELCLFQYDDIIKKITITRESMMPPITAGFSDGGAGKGTSDPTAKAAMQILTDRFLVRKQNEIKSIDTVMAKLGENEKKLMDIVYFRKANNVTGAGLKLGYSEAQSYRIINDVLSEIALEMGLISIDL